MASLLGSSGRTCRVCGIELSKYNTYTSSMVRNDWICKDCKRSTIEKARNEKRGKELDRSSTAGAKEMIKATEKLRVDSMYDLLISNIGNPSANCKIILYLLCSVDILSDNKMSRVIDIANGVIKSAMVHTDVRIKLATNLRALLSDGKKEMPKNFSYEELVGGDTANIELEVFT